MILDHHNGDLFLNIGETLVNFTKQKHPTKGGRKEEQRERTQVRVRSATTQKPKGSHKGATMKLPSFSYCSVCRLLIIEELYYHMVSHTGW